MQRKRVKLVYLVELVFYSWLRVYTAMACRTVLILLIPEGPLPGRATGTFGSRGAFKEMSLRTDHRGFPRSSRSPPIIAITPDHRDYPRSSRPSTHLPRQVSFPEYVIGFHVG